MFGKSETVKFKIEGRFKTEITGNEYINVRSTEVYEINSTLVQEGRTIILGNRIDAGQMVKIDEILILYPGKDGKKEFDAVFVEYTVFKELEEALKLALGFDTWYMNSTRGMQKYLEERNLIGKIGLHNQQVEKRLSRK